MVSLAKMKPSPIREVSIGGYITKYTVDNNTGLMTVEEFEVKELSLVISGAFPNNRRLDAKKFKEAYQMDKEYKELLAKNSELEKELKNKTEEIKQLKAELKEKNEEIQKLKAEKEKIELENYKAQKLSEFPEDVKELLEASLDVAKTKEDIDNVVAKFKEKLSKSQSLTIPNPADSHKSENNSPFISY